MTKKGRYHHGSLRPALVASAAQLAAERGPAAVSLREAARRAGVSPAAPYHYFADKSALLAAVAEEGFRLLDGLQAEALRAAPDDAIERVAALAVTYVRFALDRPHYFKAMFSRDGVTRHRYPSLDDLAERTLDRLVNAVRLARLACGHDDVDSVAAALLIWSVPHGLALLYVDGVTATEVSPRVLEGLVRASIMPLAEAEIDTLGGGEPHWGI